MNSKKSLRDDFRNAVFKRDGYACAMCGYKPESVDQLDAHHITDRHYITCHATGIGIPGYAPANLYARIKSSYKWAYLQSIKLEIEANKADAMNRIIDVISKEELEVCLRLCENTSPETWELTCDELSEWEPLIRAYGKGRYVPDN